LVFYSSEILLSSWMEHIISWEDSKFTFIQEISALYKRRNCSSVLARTHI